MKKNPLVSVIIPLYAIEERFFNDLKRFRQLRYKNYEIIVVCDKEIEIKEPRVKLIKTRKARTGPAEKRDLALKYAKGEICAFIDDDAYPDPDWLKNAIGHFQDERIAAVGGPGITPPEDGFWEQITGLIYSSFFTGGFARHRFVPEKRRFVVDYPAYNLLVRKDVLAEVGGYGNYFYGGEDTFLCLKIVKKGYKILYDPKVVIYHHRRPLFFGYLKQIANIGKHRGYFAKKFPETSRTFGYFIPSILSIGFTLLLLFSFFDDKVRVLFESLLVFFFFLAAFSIRKADPVRASIAAAGIILTHLTYGIYFLRGLLEFNLKR